MRHKLKIALQMDPLEKLDLKGDSTFILGLEAIKRGFELYFYSPSDLIYKNNNVYAKAKILDLAFENGRETFNYGKIKVLKLSSLDVILMRQDPPFNMSYITATHILEKIASQTLILNNPFHVRNAPEKVFVTEFSKFMPETLITRETNEIIKFKNKNKNIIIKPLYGNGGEGVFYIKDNDSNFNVIIENFLNLNEEQFIIQSYIPEVKKGDKRIILIDGEVVGAINRIPAKNENRSNMHVGGKPIKTSLNKNDKLICETISPHLKAKGLFFVGIDVIGNYLTEINVTSPTGIREINRLDKTNIEKIFWDKTLKML
ncbi:MAG: glutathione synthase [Candidatus Puniceispirillales bacterium]|tara:strand:- start:650 stop:1597 length:948 start_codon:yes stop_codon:yes gene_type:complete